MKKQIIISAVIIVAGLILAGAGCGTGDGEKIINGQEEKTTGTEKEIKKDDINVNSGVTQEELDRLKADIEGMEYEDLNGLKK